jgi:CheY-like chemotaxis protein
LTTPITCVLGNQEHETIELEHERLLVIYGSTAGRSFAIVPGWYRDNEKYEDSQLVAVDVEIIDPMDRPRIENGLRPILSGRHPSGDGGMRLSFWGSMDLEEGNSDSSQGEERRRDRKTVLVVDDDPSLRQIIKISLEKEGFVVRTAANSSEARGELLSGKEKPDLMLLDIMMPGGTGWQLLKELEKDPAISQMPVIAISGLEKPAQTSEEYDSKMLYDYLVKPFSMAELSRAVRKFAR